MQNIFGAEYLDQNEVATFGGAAMALGDGICTAKWCEFSPIDPSSHGGIQG